MFRDQNVKCTNHKHKHIIKNHSIIVEFLIKNRKNQKWLKIYLKILIFCLFVLIAIKNTEFLLNIFRKKLKNNNIFVIK